MILGNGGKINFWNDVWLGEMTLKETFPRIFSLANNKDGLVESFGEWNGNSFVWNVELRRPCRDWEKNEWNRFNEALNGTIMHKGTEDRLVWVFDDRGKFSVTSFCNECEIRSPSIRDFEGKFIWQGLAPPKVEFFCWLIMWNRTPTRNLLLRRNIVTNAEDALCPFCKECIEDANHVLLVCKWAWKIWCRCMDGWGMKWAVPSSLLVLGKEWKFLKAPHGNSLVWNMLFFAIIWSLWKVRNEVVFDNTQFVINDVVEAIKICLAFWVKAKIGVAGPSINDLILNATVNFNVKRSVRRLMVGDWIPPPKGSLKFNVDGSSIGKPGEAGIGGVLRNEDGAMLCLFSQSVGIHDSNVAEFLAIRKGVDVFSKSPWVGKMSLIIESDSRVALSWLKDDTDFPWRMSNLLNEVRNNVDRIGKVEFIHTYREHNHVADYLAKKGVARENEFCEWL